MSTEEALPCAINATPSGLSVLSRSVRTCGTAVAVSNCFQTQFDKTVLQYLGPLCLRQLGHLQHHGLKSLLTAEEQHWQIGQTTCDCEHPGTRATYHSVLRESSFSSSHGTTEAKHCALAMLCGALRKMFLHVHTIDSGVGSTNTTLQFPLCNAAIPAKPSPQFRTSTRLALAGCPVTSITKDLSSSS
jgi:hypothetical protein